jgi:hypothetical protein
MNTSSTGRLERDQLMQLVQILRSIAHQINELKFTRKIAGEITDVEFKELTVEESKLNKLADDLVLAIFDSILLDLQMPLSQIQTTIKKVNHSIEHLENINKIIQIASKVVDIFTTITRTIATGNIGEVATILEQIEELI